MDLQRHRSELDRRTVEIAGRDELAGHDGLKRLRRDRTGALQLVRSVQIFPGETDEETLVTELRRGDGRNRAGGQEPAQHVEDLALPVLGALTVSDNRLRPAQLRGVAESSAS